MEILIGLAVAFVVLWIVVAVITQRTLARLDDVRVITTSLNRAELDALIRRSLKGRNPLAKINQPDSGIYERSLRRGAASNKNVALIRIEVEPAESQPGLWQVAGLIKDFRYRTILGAGKTGAARAGLRRIDKLLRAIQTADPEAQPELQLALVERS